MKALPRRFFLLFAAVYLYAFPFFGALHNANEMPRILMTQEIVDRGVFYLDRRVAAGETSTTDLSRGPDGHLYPNKAPGASFLAVPAYLVCKALGFTSLRACTWAFRVTAVTIPALLFLPFFYRQAWRFAPDESARRTALAAYALGSPALVYAMLFFSHQLAAVCAGGAFVAAVALTRGRARRPENAAAATGLLGGLAVMMDYQAAIAVAIVGLYVLVRARQRMWTAILVGAGALPPAAAMAAYHKVCFGAALKTGYSYSFDTITRSGFMGIIGPQGESFWSTLFLPANGIVVLAPWVLLAVAGAVAIKRDPAARARIGAEAVVCAAVGLAYVLFLGCLEPFMARGGWCVGPRYMTVALPFLAWLAAAGLEAAERRRWTAVLAQALVVASGVVFVVAATTYPHWPENLQNPLYELAFRLLWRGYAVHSVGTLVGLHGLAAILPLYFLAFGLMFWLLARGPRASWRTTALACVVGALIVAGHRTFPLSGKYAEHVWGFVTTQWEPKP